MSEHDRQQDRIDATAAAWTARLGDGPLNSNEQHDLDRWLRENPRHARAFDEARSAWAEMDRVARAPGRLGHDIVALRRPARRWLRASAIAACLLLVAVVLRLWGGDPLVMIAADYRTGPGELRLVSLADGSTVELGPASAIAVTYTAAARRLELLAGVAYFRVAPADRMRPPFIVVVADGSARALGTQFMVDRLPRRVEVVVAEHAVEVTVGAPASTAVVLKPGEAVSYIGAKLGAAGPVNLARATAWRRGRLVFDDVPLADVVATMNRYRRGRIVIASTALAARRVSGVFETADADEALATLVRDLRIDVAGLPPLVTLLY